MKKRLTEQELKNLVDNIKLLRSRFGWSIEKLADEVLLSPSGMKKILRGQTIPQDDTLDNISSAFGIPITVLISDDLSEEWVYYKQLREEAFYELARMNSEPDTNETKLMFAIRRYISPNHVRIKRIMEKFNFRSVYIPSFEYSEEEYMKCIDSMKDYYSRQKNPPKEYMKLWETYGDKNALHKVLKDNIAGYVNEQLNYPILFNRIAENKEHLNEDSPALRHLQLDILIFRFTDKGAEFVSQIPLFKYVQLTNNIAKNIEDTILSSIDMQDDSIKKNHLFPPGKASMKN